MRVNKNYNKRDDYQIIICQQRRGYTFCKHLFRICTEMSIGKFWRKYMSRLRDFMFFICGLESIHLMKLK